MWICRENDVCSQISGFRWQPLGSWIWANISLVRIRRGMKRMLVLAVPGSWDMCPPQPVWLRGWALGTRGLSSACPSSLFPGSVSHSAEVQVLELSAPSQPCCQLQVMSSAQQMLSGLWVISPVSPGGSLRGWVVRSPSSSAWLVPSGLSLAPLLAYCIIYFSKEYSRVFLHSHLFLVLSISMCVAQMLHFYVERRFSDTFL